MKSLVNNKSWYEKQSQKQTQSGAQLDILFRNLFSKLLVRAECVRQRNEVAIKLGIIFSSSLLSLSLLFPSSAKSPRESCRRVPKFCICS